MKRNINASGALATAIVCLSLGCTVEEQPPAEENQQQQEEERGSTSSVLEELGVAREATSPKKRMTLGGDGGGDLTVSPFNFEGSDEAGDASASAAYDESCEAVTNDDGTTVVSCTWDDGSEDGVLCTEVYDAEGRPLSWSCEGYGSYVCSYDGAASCTYDDGNGFSCSDVYDESWALVSSDCPWAEEQPSEQPYPEEQCVENDDGTVSCSYSDPEWTCSYTFAAGGDELLSASCSGAYGSVDCARTAEGALSCAYAYDGFAACTEVYADNAYYGLLSSDCDWNADGAPDCASLAEGGVSCAYDDGETQCSWAYDAEGDFVSQSCTYDGGTWDCLSVESGVECTATSEGGQSCSESYDLELNLVESSCGR